MKAFIWPIVKQICLLSLMTCLYYFTILPLNIKAQTIWAVESINVLQLYNKFYYLPLWSKFLTYIYYSFY